MPTKISSEERVGTTNKNNFGTVMEVVEYNTFSDIWVKFINRDIYVHTSWQAFLKGNVRNPYDKSVYGIGYIGEGNYKTKINNKATHQYRKWKHMLDRCYNEKIKERLPTYKDCSVAEEWLNFQNFAAWYDENYYEVEGEKMELDKDILFKGNKLYSPDTCLFVPERVNMLFTKCNQSRGKLPIGVDWRKTNKKYRSRYSNKEGKEVHIGYFDTPEEAFVAYKSKKEKVIKEVAAKYRYIIPSKLYTALMEYEVDIND